MRRLLVLLTLSTALVAATLSPTTSWAAQPGTATAATIPTTRYVAITTGDGTRLHAFVVQPPGAGPFPLLVMPSSWGVNDIEYVGAAQRLAFESGYAVISYTARGFWDSGGTIQVAGPQDVADARSVVDWGIANAAADPLRIGMAGISYGAGISLLAAAHDARIHAVAAMSGWSDLAASLYPGETISDQAGLLLLALGAVTGRPGEPLRRAQQGFLTGDVAPILEISPERSASTLVDSFNANGTAVFVAQAYEDAIFPPQQLVDFVQRLSSPYRLDLGPGDHATREVFGAAGLPNAVWADLGRWMDHWVRGVDNGVESEPAVRLTPENGGSAAGYPSWPAATRSTDRRYLGAPAFLTRTGALEPTVRTGWTHTVLAGLPSLADSGTAIITGALQGLLQIGPTTSLPLVSRSAAGVWVGPALSTTGAVRGTARLHATLTPSSNAVSAFAYLYDVDAIGLAQLVTHKPLTLRGRAGRATSVDVRLEPTDWTVRAGHRLALVVDTVDPRYRSASTLGTTLSFSSPAADPSYLDLPMG